MIDVLWLAGTFNPNGEGISDTFAKHLDPKRFRFRYVPYPADYGKVVSYAESSRLGEIALARAVWECPGAVVVGGYSQGATIAGNYAAKYEAKPRKVIGCALIADPLRIGDAPVVNGNPGGYGIGGQRRIDSTRLLQVAAWGDPITSLPAGNYLRTVADFSEFMGRDVNAWALDVAGKVIRGQLQPWWRWSNRRDWAEAGRWLRGYTHDGRHTDAYIRDGLCQQLAQAVNREIR
ncbi:cutinase family protein [Rhodococcoides fascians]|uniref:cutinase family protein n=1 Tax=Rhodococcoides fascians TaxID=1828 RepID=UPI00056D2ACA|nr:cutinase family protein [Rhodococcus fascians]